MQHAVQTSSGLEVALAVWHRRKWPALLVIVVLLSATAAVARSLPNVYKSTATVLVEHQQAPQSLAGPWAADELETRLRTISQQIMSRSRLYEVITRFDLYPALRRRATPEALVERMRRDIQLQFNGVRQTTGLDATIAFSLSYQGRDSETVAQVTNALAALFVEENAKIREQQAAGTTEFLQAQVEDAKRKLDAEEQRIIAFKERHIGELPEQQAVNLAAMERLTGQLRVIMDRRDELAKRLAVPAAAGDTPSARLAKLRQDLADLRIRDTDEHPDVVRLKHEIADLESRLAAGGSGHAAAGDPPGSQLTAPGTAAEAELTALRNQEQALRREIAAYEQRIEAAPLREQELQQFSRDHTAAQQLYQSLLQRYEDAQLAQRLQQQRLQGEQFRILDPAVASQLPVAPHRARLLLMGLMISVGTAVGVALLAEARDTSFHSVDDVRAFTSIPVLVSVPPIVTETDTRRRRRQFVLAAAAAAFGIAAVVGVSSYLAHTNDALVGLLAHGNF